MGGEIERAGDGAVIRCTDPRDGASLGTVACTPAHAIPGLVARARQAQVGWWDQGLAGRKKAVKRLHQAFLANADRFATLLAEECGRPAGEAWTSEIVANGDLFAWWLGHVDDILTRHPLGLNPLNYPKKRGVVQLEPRGVIGLVTPWNLPVAIPLRALVPALLAGNTVVFKPSEHSPRTGALLAELCAGALPEGVVTLVQGGGEQGEALVRARPDMVIFTGSVRTGRAISAIAGELMMPVALELGGKDAALVLADADLERAAAGITWAAFGFAGQNCAAVERCYVDRSVYDALLDKLVARARALRPFDDVGPLVTEAQLAVVRRHVAEAVAAGATVRCGGKATGQGLYHEPTVLTEVSEEMAVMREETFGPVLPVVPFDDLDEAVRRVNATPYGLTTSVWTRDLERGESMASSFECGVVTVNNHSFTGALPDGAWGGVKDSGHGVTNSRWSLYEMVRPRTVLVDAMSAPREMWWYPYNAALVDVARGLTELARSDGQRLRGVRAALSGLINRWKADT